MTATMSERPGQRIEIVQEAGKRTTIPLTAAFVERIAEIVDDPYAGYLDLADLIRAALRSEVDRAEKGISAKRWRERETRR